MGRGRMTTTKQTSKATSSNIKHLYFGQREGCQGERGCCLKWGWGNRFEVCIGWCGVRGFRSSLQLGIIDTFFLLPTFKECRKRGEGLLEFSIPELWDTCPGNPGVLS